MYFTENEKMKYFTYILKLRKDHIYVGMTSNPLKRLSDHFNGKGAQWTQLYSPKEILSIETHENYETARKRETEKYFEMKNIHGIEKVRGAGHTKSF